GALPLPQSIHWRSARDGLADRTRPAPIGAVRLAAADPKRGIRGWAARDCGGDRPRRAISHRLAASGGAVRCACVLGPPPGARGLRTRRRLMATVAGFLVIEFDGDIVRTLPLSYGVLRIGRGPDNDLALQHRGVSRNHVELHVTADGILVTDLGSVNGTFIDGERLLSHQPTRLELGQELRVGPFVLAPRRSPSDQPDGAVPTPLEREPRPPRRDIEWVPPPTVERRPSLPVPAPNAQRSRYLNYLPAIFSDNDFLGRYLLVFESIWEPMEQRQDHIEMYLSPATCPASFLPWLASWFDLTVSPHWPERHVRELVQQAMDLYRWRGT